LEEIKTLEEQIKNLNAISQKTDNDVTELRYIKLKLIDIKNTDEGKKALLLKYMEDNKVPEDKKTFHDSFNYNYLNLTTMKPDIIEDISTRINGNNYKYYAVDKDFKMIHSYTTSELIKFTKGYSQNINYPMSIIDYIIFSKIQRDKNINI
jgi:hypothetical protein